MSINVPDDSTSTVSGGVLKVLAWVYDGSPVEIMLRKMKSDRLAFHFEHPDSGQSQNITEIVEIDVIVIDMSVDSLDDVLNLTHSIHAETVYADVPIVGITNHDDIRIISRFLSVGGSDFVSMPLNETTLALKLEMVLKHGHEESRLRERTERLTRRIAQRDDELDDLRRFAQDIVSGISSVLLVLDENLTVLFANEAFKTIRDMELSEVMGLLLNQLLSSDAIEQGLPDKIAAVAYTTQPLDIPRIQGLFYEKEQNIYHLRVSSIVYGNARQILLLVEDVTERALVERKVLSERRKLQEVVDALGASLILININAKMLWSNKVFEETFGESAEPARRMAFWNRLHNGPMPLGAIADAGRPFIDNWVFIGGDGATHHYKNLFVPLERKDEGEAPELLVLVQDMTTEEIHGQQLGLMREVWEVMGSILDLESLFHVIMVAATAGHALGFNRAFLFIRDPERNELVGHMAVGPASREDAFRIWSELTAKVKSLPELLKNAEENVPAPNQQPLYPLIAGLRYSLNTPTEVLVRVAIEKKPVVISNVAGDSRISDDFRRRFGAQEITIAPLISKGAIMGVLLADNVYSGRSVTDEHMHMLSIFAGLAGLAIENAMTVDELRNTMEQLQETQDKLLHSERLATVGRMAAHVAHEIRNPLATIGGFANSIIKKPTNSQRVIRSARIISEETRRLENILKTVMDFSRPAKPLFVNANLNKTIDNCIKHMQPEIESGNVEISADLDPALPDTRFDMDQIHQVLVNILRNALQAMNGNPPDKPKHLEVRTERREKYVAAWIRDTGCGIPSEKVEQLFSPFYTTKADGTGLGLAVVQQIILEHGGSIDVNSLVDEGTTFEIRLPITAEVA